MKNSMKRVYLVRHGQTVGNLERFYQRPETPLSELGVQQAGILADRLSHLQIDAVITSNMLRAQQTAEVVSQKINLEVDVVDFFHERLQPYSIRGVLKDSEDGVAYADAYYSNYCKDEVYEEGFENYKLVTERAVKCKEFLEQYDAQNIVVVTHSAFLHSLAALLLLQGDVGKEMNLLVSDSLQKMTNAAITEFTFDDKWQLAMWNDNAHFAE